MVRIPSLLLGVGLAAMGACGGGSGDDTPLVDAGPPDADPPDAQPLGDGVGTLAGTAKAGDLDGERNVARFNNPVNVAVALDGTVYVADFVNGSIRRVTASGTVTTVVQRADFARPFGLVFAPDGKLWVQTDRNAALADQGALWKVDVQSGDAVLVEDNFGRPRGLAFLSDGRMVHVRYLEHVVEIYDPGSRTRSLLAGQKGTTGFVDATGAAARFNTPYDAVVEPGDVIVVSDSKNHRLRQITLAGVVTTRAGTGVAGGDEGAALTATFNQPTGLARDQAGVIYVSDVEGHRLRSLSGGVVTTIAGDGVADWADSPMRLRARFFGLEGLDVGNDGAYLYAADGDRGESLPYHRVRRVNLAGL